jgi:hypothetical protein
MVKQSIDGKREIVLPFNSRTPWYAWFIAWSHAISHLGRWLLLQYHISVVDYCCNITSQSLIIVAISNLGRWLLLQYHISVVDYCCNITSRSLIIVAISHLGLWLLYGSVRVITMQPRFKVCHISSIRVIGLSCCLHTCILVYRR